MEDFHPFTSPYPLSYLSTAQISLSHCILPIIHLSVTHTLLFNENDWPRSLHAVKADHVEHFVQVF